jgi:hypothetical protein
MSEQRPLSELGAQLWAKYGDEMRAVLAEAPELTPEQIRVIRAVLLPPRLPRKATDADQ